MAEGDLKLGKLAIHTDFHQVGLSDRLQDSQFSLKFKWTMIFRSLFPIYLKSNLTGMLYLLKLANLLTREMFLVQNRQDYCSKI